MNSRMIITVLCILFSVCYAGALAAQSAPAGKFPVDYRIDPENVLQIDVYYGKGEKIARQVRVSSSGEINLSFVGDVAVAGLTIPELQKKLNQLFDKGESLPPQVNVSIEEYSMVTIMGEVKKPGAYPIKSSLTVVELIALAEGFSEAASANEVKIVHTNADGSKTETPVRVHDLMNKAGKDQNGYFLRSRDVVIVPKSMVTIIGEVRKPGAYPIKSYLSALDLIALAEGFNDAAASNEVKIIHTNPDGTKTQRVVPLYDIMNKGSMVDDSLLLSSDDVVIVPRGTVTIIGEVTKPGIYPTKGRLTIIDLVAMAEGLTKFALPNELKVIHVNPDGTKAERVVPLYEMMKKGSIDHESLLLYSGDVVFVR